MVKVFEFQEGRNNKRPLVLLRVPREHDLVLEMDTAAERRKFLVKLDTFLAQHKKALNLSQVKNNNQYLTYWNTYAREIDSYTVGIKILFSIPMLSLLCHFQNLNYS